MIYEVIQSSSINTGTFYRSQTWGFYFIKLSEIISIYHLFLKQTKINKSLVMAQKKLLVLLFNKLILQIILLRSHYIFIG